MKINNVEVYGINESVKASGYPMQVDIESDTSHVTKSDLSRAEKLANNRAGSGHNCFLKGIVVQADVTCSQYWWLQFGRYHFADIISSQSKMHRITQMDIDKQCNQYVFASTIKAFKGWIKKYKNGQILFQELIANCPMGLELTARITTNYLQLKTIYNQRKNHRLIEWQKFCVWIETLEYSEWITDGS